MRAGAFEVLPQSLDANLVLDLVEVLDNVILFDKTDFVLVLTAQNLQDRDQLVLLVYPIGSDALLNLVGQWVARPSWEQDLFGGPLNLFLLGFHHKKDLCPHAAETPDVCLGGVYLLG
jgi:hypothetical protein